MLKQKNDDVYNFSSSGTKYEIFFAEDGHIEIYEEKNPGKTGFIFDDIRKISFFINTITDIIEKRIVEKI